MTDTEEILRRMQAYNARRTQFVHGYTGNRTYHVEYTGIVNKSADMAARMIYAPSGEKRFEIQSESGSKLLRNRVLRKILESEVEAARSSSRDESAINPNNYSFRLLPNDNSPNNDCYILEAIPRRKSKFLFIGKIWVHSCDFAIVRIEGRPAVNPSWWINKATILQTYRKVGDFWLNDTNESTSGIRIGGKAVLRIRYLEYDLDTEPVGGELLQ